jgi:hypothetical protein
MSDPAGVAGNGVTNAKDLYAAAWRLLDRYRSAFVVLVLCVLIGLMLGGVIGPSAGGHSGAGRKTMPHEYMYLDSTRVASYLGQVDGGEVGPEEDEKETTTNNENFDVGKGTVGAATSKGQQLVKSIVVKKSDADRFSDLLGDLEAKHSSTWLGKLNAEQPCKFVRELDGTAIPDGSIVMIENAGVQIPPYMSAYPELRYAEYRVLPATQSRKTRKLVEEVFRGAPLTSFRAVDESVRGTPKLELEKFKKRVGKNPRIPFSFTVSASARQMQECERERAEPKTVVPDLLEPKATESSIAKSRMAEAGKSGEEAKVTVVLPARFADLTGDPSLLSGPLTIVGILVDNDLHGFGDGTSVSSYWPALSVAKRSLLRELGVKSRYLTMARVALREHLFHALERSLTYEGHVVDVIPIAMYD